MKRWILAASAVAILGGCATFSPDGGFGAVESRVKTVIAAEPRWQRTEAEREEARAAVRALLAQPLTADTAERIALLAHPGLQATYAELGIAESDLVQAGRLSNPRYHVLRTKYGNAVEKVEESLSLELMQFITKPLARRMESRRFERVQARVAQETVRVALDARRAWVNAVAAEEAVRYALRVRDAAEASAELARRMTRAGNFPRLTQMREQVFYAEAAAMLARTKEESFSARERLIRALGVADEAALLKLPERLPDLPMAVAEAGELESAALARRFDIEAAQRDLASLAESLGLTKATRFINVLEVGRARTKEGRDPFAYGWSFSLEIPLFDWGGSRVAQSEALYMQGASQLAATLVNARSELREAQHSRTNRWDTARHIRDEIVPLRKQISEENLLRYNGMLISVFELLADAREQVSSVSAYLEALRDFWMADAELKAALAGAGPSNIAAPSRRAAAAAGGGGH